MFYTMTMASTPKSTELVKKPMPNLKVSLSDLKDLIGGIPYTTQVAQITPPPNFYFLFLCLF